MDDDDDHHHQQHNTRKRRTTSTTAFVFPPLNLGSSLNRYLRKNSRVSCRSDLEEAKLHNDKGRLEGGENKHHRRYQLEEEVKTLQTQLQEEIDLRLALANAVEPATDLSSSNSTSQLPVKRPWKSRAKISDQISLLTDLVTLSNYLEGIPPSGLGHKSLTQLDLSNNQFTGSIPDCITASSLQIVLLNGNLLEGLVPEQLYSIGMHGGEIDLSDNKGLCGVPSLPDCSLIWENGGLSKGGKIGIALACFIFVSLLLSLIYIC